MKVFIILFLFHVSTFSFSQKNSEDSGDRIIEKLGDKVFLRILKHQTWRYDFSADTLKKGDTLSVWSRRGDRRASKAFNSDYEKHHNGDVKFTRNHKISQLTVSTFFEKKNGKTVKKRKISNRQIGKWSFEKSRLFLNLDKSICEIEWIEDSRDFIKITIHDIRIKD